MNEDMQKFCNFLEAILMMCTLWLFLEMSKDHILKYIDAIHNVLEKSLLKQTVQKHIIDYFKG
jgi:hypothetical protein